MTLTLPTREATQEVIRNFNSAVGQLPEDSAYLLDAFVRNRKSLEDIAETLGITEGEAAIRFADAMRSLHTIIHDPASGIFDVSTAPSQESDLGVSGWPLARVPLHGEVEALLAGANHFRESERWNDAIVLLIRAADTARAAGQPLNSAKALRLTGTCFLRLADERGTSENDRKTFLYSAKSYLEDARSISELMRDHRTTGAILCDLASVYFAQEQIALARTLAHLSGRYCDTHGDAGLRDRIKKLLGRIDGRSRIPHDQRARTAMLMKISER